MTAMTLAVYAKDNKTTKVDTLVYTPTPVLTCTACENKVKGQLRFIKGTKNVSASHKTQQITIVYDPQKARPVDYEEVLRKLHYTVRRSR